MSRSHQHTPSRAAPGPPGTASEQLAGHLSRVNHLSHSSHDNKAFLSAVSHQNGGIKNTNHVTNQRNSQHHSKRHPSSHNSAHPVLPSNINQVKERGGSRQQPNLDCLRVPDQGAAGWETGTHCSQTVQAGTDKLTHTKQGLSHHRFKLLISLNCAWTPHTAVSYTCSLASTLCLVNVVVSQLWNKNVTADLYVERVTSKSAVKQS